MSLYQHLKLGHLHLDQSLDVPRKMAKTWAAAVLTAKAISREGKELRGIPALLSAARAKTPQGPVGNLNVMYCNLSLHTIFPHFLQMLFKILL